MQWPRVSACAATSIVQSSNPSLMAPLRYRTTPAKAVTLRLDPAILHASRRAARRNAACHGNWGLWVEDVIRQALERERKERNS
jgi:hypothetical protein